MTKLILLSGRSASALSMLVLFVAIGCSTEGPDGNGGGGGGAAGIGGTAGVGGAGGDGGAGGVDARTALETCQAWCRNETGRPSCCFESPFFGEDCRRNCYDLCEETVTEMSCSEEWVSARECQLQLACDDFFDECEALDGRVTGCELRADAEESGRCASAAAWNLDDGTTQELTLENLDATINAAGLDLEFTTAPGGNCTWDPGPPSVTFSML